MSLPPPITVAWSSIAARTMLWFRTWIETEAPMPTLPLLASESALAVSSSLAWAFTVTSPVPAFTTAPPGTIASVWSVTMFSASEPAMLTLSLSPPAPDSASAMMSCSASR